MSYSFKPGDASVSDGLRRIALSQIDAALDEIADASLPVEETVHQVRKRCKKLRGLIRLVRPGFDAYKKENAFFRDAARSLSELRDAGVVTDTLDAIAKRASAHGGAFDAVGDAIDAQAAGTRRNADTDRALQAFAAKMRKARKRARAWTADIDDRDLPGGLEKTYARGRAAMATARKDPSPENLHDWRKRVKYHWYHARLLKRTAPNLIEPHRKFAAQLADLLGEQNDVAVLIARLPGLAGEAGSSEVEAVLEEARKHRIALTDRSFRLGRLLYAEKPSALERRFGTYWKAYWDHLEPENPVGLAAE